MILRPPMLRHEVLLVSRSPLQTSSCCFPSDVHRLGHELLSAGGTLVKVSPAQDGTSFTGSQSTISFSLAALWVPVTFASLQISHRVQSGCPDFYGLRSQSRCRQMNWGMIVMCPVFQQQPMPMLQGLKSPRVHRHWMNLPLLLKGSAPT